ncbi:MAG: LTA synthase family protein [Lawsonibacter sp.]|nr:LTA synthase family protein [Lawsonibacter sp.]
MRALLYADTFPRLAQDIRQFPGTWLSRLLFLAGPWAAFWMVEILNENDIFSDLYPWQVLMNLVWYYLLFLLCRLIFGRRAWAGTAGIGLSFLVGLVNHYVLRFRGRILFPADVAGWRTAANVAGGFDFSPDWYICQAAVLLIVYLSALWLCPRQKRRDRLRPLAAAALLLAGAGYCFAFFATGMLPNLGIYTQQWVTQANGFLLNFTVALRYSRVDRPEGYSREEVLRLAAEYPAAEGDPSAVKPVNIVVIMNESFADLTLFDSLDGALEEDPTPFLRTLKEDTVRGWMYSPVTGGGTASVEFEYLTGFSTLFQPPHTVAYQLYVEEDMPSLAQSALARGYHTTAFHPYKSSGWNRPVAYQCLSFLDQLYEEDVEDPWRVRTYVSDLSDYRRIFRITGEAGGPSFVFNVTMQNHSGYSQGWNNLDRTIQLPARLRTADSTAEQYFALVRASDDALRELIAHYSQVEEPTLVVFFGDHQPPLKNAFYEELYGKRLSERTAGEVLQQYAVPFFLWANYDIEEQEDVVLSPNYLGALTARLAGLPLTGFQSFLLRMYQELPVITPVGFLTGDGEALSRQELTPEQQEWIHTYEVLNYCGMTDLFDEAREMFCLPAERSGEN